MVSLKRNTLLRKIDLNLVYHLDSARLAACIEHGHEHALTSSSHGLRCPLNQPDSYEAKLAQAFQRIILAPASQIPLECVGGRQGLLRVSKPEGGWDSRLGCSRSAGATGTGPGEATFPGFPPARPVRSALPAEVHRRRDHVRGRPTGAETTTSSSLGLPQQQVVNAPGLSSPIDAKTAARAFPCGSMSTSKTLLTAVFFYKHGAAVVVLATPPFWLAIAITRIPRCTALRPAT